MSGMRRLWITSLFAALTFAAAGGAAAAPPADSADDIVVTARASGAPIWEVTDGERRLILVGALRGIPKDVAWSPAGLERAVRRADRVLYPIEPKVSVGDVFRLLFRSGKVTRLPKGQTAADYLPPELYGRLSRLLQDKGEEDWQQRSPVLLSFRLLTREAGFRGRGRDLADIVGDEAKRAKVPGRPVGSIRGKDVIDTLMAQPPRAYARCIAASVDAAEAGPEGFVARGRAWADRDIPALIANPLDRALGLCWPWADPAIGPRLKTTWTDAIRMALRQPGTTLAVAPVRLLAEPGGVLDTLASAGLSISGPAWRPDR